MLKFNPSVDYIDKDKNTVLHVAVSNKNNEVIATVFTNCMSNLHCANNKGQTPLYLAVKMQNTIAVQMFQSHITCEMAVAIHDECLRNCGIDLLALCIKKCETLTNYVASPLARIILDYLGFSSNFKKIFVFLPNLGGHKNSSTMILFGNFGCGPCVLSVKKKSCIFFSIKILQTF